MKRREFIAGLGSAAAWPMVARGQTSSKIARVGFLGVGPPSAWMNQTNAFRAGLRDAGRVEGKNLIIEFRWAEEVNQLPALAADLVKANVDVILASTEVEPARQVTKTIPIVFAQHADPIGVGHVATLSASWAIHREATMKVGYAIALSGWCGYRCWCRPKTTRTGYAASLRNCP